MLGRFQSGEAASSDEDRRFGQIHLDKIQHQRLVERVIETSRDDLRFGHRSAFEPASNLRTSFVTRIAIPSQTFMRPSGAVILLGKRKAKWSKRTGYFYPLTNFSELAGLHITRALFSVRQCGKKPLCACGAVIAGQTS
jgi:hypothetical protein